MNWSRHFEILRKLRRKKRKPDCVEPDALDILLQFEKALQQIPIDSIRMATRAAIGRIEFESRDRVAHQPAGRGNAPPERRKNAEEFRRIAERKSKLYADAMVVGTTIHHASAQFWGWAMAEYGPAEARAVAPAIFQDTLWNVEDGYRDLTGLAICLLTLEPIAQFFEHGPTGLRTMNGLSLLLDAVADWTGAARYLGEVGTQEQTDPPPMAIFPAPGGALVGHAYRQIVAIRSYLPATVLTDAQHEAITSAPAPERSLISGEIYYLPVPEQIGWMFTTGLLFGEVAGEQLGNVDIAGDPYDDAVPVLLDTRLVTEGAHAHRR